MTGSNKKKNKKRQKKQYLQEEVYNVEAIKDHEIQNDGSIAYLVKWLGYEEQDNTWENQAQLVTCLQLVYEYHYKSQTLNLVRDKQEFQKFFVQNQNQSGSESDSESEHTKKEKNYNQEELNQDEDNNQENQFEIQQNKNKIQQDQIQQQQEEQQQQLQEEQVQEQQEGDVEVEEQEIEEFKTKKNSNSENINNNNINLNIQKNQNQQNQQQQYENEIEEESDADHTISSSESCSQFKSNDKQNKKSKIDIQKEKENQIQIIERTYDTKYSRYIYKIWDKVSESEKVLSENQIEKKYRYIKEKYDIQALEQSLNSDQINQSQENNINVKRTYGQTGYDKNNNMNDENFQQKYKQYGNLFIGDQPNKIIKNIIYNPDKIENWEFYVSWNKRKDGTIPQNSLVSYNDLIEQYSLLIYDYVDSLLEDKISKQKIKNEKYFEKFVSLEEKFKPKDDYINQQYIKQVYEKYMADNPAY